VRALLWLVFFVLISFAPFIGKNVLHLISAPVEHELAKYWDKYYKNRKREVEEKLAEGDKELEDRNRPINVIYKIPRWQFDLETARSLDRLSRSDPKLRKLLGPDFDPDRPKAHLDILATVTPIAEKLEIADWLEEVEPSSGSTSDSKRWVRFNARMQDPLKVQAKFSENSVIVGRRPALSTLNVQEAFMVYVKVCLITGLVLASPMIFYQLWSFVAAGLYPHEKRYVHLYLPFSIGLFLTGVVVCEVFVIPKAVEALLWFNEWLGMEPDLRLGEWLGFAIFMPVLFGISFQTPLVMLFMERMGIMKVETYRRGRRMAWFIMAVFAAICTPSTDALSMIFLWAPMCLLYELGIFLCYWTPKRPELEIEVPEGEEMVEV
jgi:Tat protein translocase TatC